MRLLPVVTLLAASLARGETCGGIAPTTGCTVNGVVGPCVGTDGDDRIEGTDGNDVIIAGGGKDVVRGGAGDDVICGGDGDDDLRKNGSGRAQIDGGPGRDRIRGGTSDDVLVGGTDDDKIMGGKGADTILCGQGRNEKANGGPGEDACQCAYKGKCERTPSLLRPPTSTTIPPGVTTTLIGAPSTSTTSSTSRTSSTSTPTTSSTSTTLCVPRTCEDAGVECGGVDDGCGGIASCAPCPMDKPLCILETCRNSCDGLLPFERCDSDRSECTLEYCSLEGLCEIADVTTCSPLPCQTSASCNPSTGACDANGYLDDLTPCQYAPGEPMGRCASGECAVGKECVIDGVAYDAGDENPGNLCQACQPGLARDRWTMLDNGSACPDGICANAACSNSVCFAGNSLRNPGDVNPSNTCQECNPTLKLSGWSPVTDGKPCPTGFCVAGRCDATVCVIDGVVYASGAKNPANPCQACDVSKSRTAWTTLPDFTFCGTGCISGVCQLAFGGCVTAGPSCPARPCATGFCNNDGTCVYIPSGLPGRPCTEPDPTGCTASQGTCNVLGVCVRQNFPGNTCTPRGGTANLCVSSTTGTCDSSGNCLAQPVASGTPCTPPSPAPCTEYRCNGSGTCQTLQRSCPTRPELLDRCTAACNPETNACEYNAIFPSGHFSCAGSIDPDWPCCDNQFCGFPPDCGPFCLRAKRCYGYGSYTPPP